MSASTPRDRFQILALDGGGAKALFTAHVLARLEEDLDTVVADSFDLITGTSAGAIIAIALGLGMKPSDIVEHYTSLITDVFPKGLTSWRSVRRLVRPAYDSEALSRALTSVFGYARFGASRKRLVVPTWNAQLGKVYLFKTPHHEMYRRDWRVSATNVALASSAAPTFFSAARVDGQRFADGGVWANNPSLVGIAEAAGPLGIPLSNISVLNIGTTVEPSPHPKHLDDSGIVGWAPHVVRLVLSASNRGGEALAGNLLGPEHYTRFDAQVPVGEFALDRVNKSDLAGYAATASRSLSTTYSSRFMAHVASPYDPLYS